MILEALWLLQAGMPSQALANRVEALLPRTPIPREGQVAVLTATSADTVYLGDQLEILTTAWFPVSVRQRLRRPPTLRPPSLNGVYSLPVVTLPGAAASRTVGETEYELFASHQVVFPVTEGRLTVPAAELSFTVPGGRPLFGEDRTDDRRSAVRLVTVLPPPAAGRPAGFNGVVARELRLTWRPGAQTMRVGELLAVDLLVAGRGNLNLWSPPPVAWPAVLRVYPDAMDASPNWAGGRLGGVRRTRFLLMADSVGNISLPEVRLPWFDPGSGRYREAVAGAVVIPVLPPVATGVSRTPPPWIADRAPAWTVRRLPARPAAWLLLGLAGPALFVAVGVMRRRRVVAPAPPGASSLDRFERLLERACGESLAVDTRSVARRLRRAGFPRREAETAVVLHERLRRRRYAPQASGDEESPLRREAEAWLARLPTPLLRRYLASMAWLALGLAGEAVAQRPEPAVLYREGAWEAAASAQAEVLGLVPDAPDVRHNLAAALWMAGRDGEAAAALLDAYRAAPRDPAIRRLWAEMALTHQQLRPLAPPVPVTPPELVMAGLVGWTLGWLALALGWRRVAGTTLGLAVVVASAGVGLAMARARPSAIMAQPAPLRLSPHGLAPVIGTADGLALVALEEERPGWARVRDPLGRSGWVPAAAVAPLRRID